jgi:murein DD-endopeptidase MepM/ murein hydrolase activator NlpD
MTGLATGPHLHFEILVDGVQRDPRVALRSRGGMPIASSERGLFDRMKTRTLATFGISSASTN